MSATKKERTVLEMKNVEARAFFLKPESYCNLDLPAYFNFRRVLSAVAKKLNTSPLDNKERKTARTYEGVNYSLLSNKDGRYTWRPFQLIHPALYVSLVNEITRKEHWDTILKRFKQFQSNDRIICLSIPVHSRSARKDKGAQILEWWLGVEQKSIELSMDFQYTFHADITDCYGSIYTHSIAWALHDKQIAKDKRNDSSLIGNIIDWYIQDMRHGQTNGIPQGSVLMDFVAEMVLGYADLLLNDRIAGTVQGDYYILRYRDDYRIFVNNPQAGEAILKALTEVLIDLGLKLNTSKTTSYRPVISSSLKPDKLAWILKRQEDENLQKHLFIIHAHGCEYPNAGSLVVALSDFYKRINRLKKLPHPHVLISIVVDIAYNSPRTIPICAAIISKLLSIINDKKEVKEILDKVYKKLSQFPNTGLMEVWLQRIGYFYDLKLNYSEKLCNVVYNQEESIWNNDWIRRSELKNTIMSTSIIDKKAMDGMKSIISRKEIEIFVY